MRRRLAIVLLALLPLQFSWAAVASYCGHETQAATGHFGHHGHPQHADAPVDVTPLVDPQAAGDNTSGALDVDCSHCHGHCSALLTPSAEVNQRLRSAVSFRGHRLLLAAGDGPPDGAPIHYERHRPEQATLYRLVQQHPETLFAQAEVAAGADLPPCVKDGLDAFLECAILANGFLRPRCADCGHVTLVAFACKRRGLCPSCGARRMAQTAAHLARHVILYLPLLLMEQFDRKRQGQIDRLLQPAPGSARNDAERGLTVDALVQLGAAATSAWQWDSYAAPTP